MEGEQKAIPFPTCVKLYMISYGMSNFAAGLGIATRTNFWLSHFGARPETLISYVYAAPYFGLFLQIASAMLADSYTGYFRQWIFCICVTPFFHIVPIFTTLSHVIPVKEGLGIVKVHMILNSFLLAIQSPVEIPAMGDQFVLPHQKDQLSVYFFYSYMIGSCCKNFGYYIGPTMFMMKCMGSEQCFFFPKSLQFGMFLLAVFPVATHKYFKKTPAPGYNMYVKTINLFYIAYANKRKHPVRRKYWLDNAQGFFSFEYIEDMKRLKILVLMLPLPIFYSLHTQEFDIWMQLSRKMDGRVGGITIRPGQILAAHSILIVLLIPLFHGVIYPFFARRDLLKDRLVRISIGGLLLGVAFLTAAGLCYVVEDTEPRNPTVHEGYLRIYNNMNCKMNISLEILKTKEHVTIGAMDYYENFKLQVDGLAYIPYSYVCGNVNQTGLLEAEEKKVIAYYVKSKGIFEKFEDTAQKNPEGYPLVRTLINAERIIFFEYELQEKIQVASSSDEITLKPVDIGEYDVLFDDEVITKTEFRLGGIYVLLAEEDPIGNTTFAMHEVVARNTVNVLWLLPHFFLITCSEIMVSISINEFFYTQSPVTLKAFVCSLFTFANCLSEGFMVVTKLIMSYDLLSMECIKMAGLIGVFEIFFTVSSYQNQQVPIANERLPEHSGLQLEEESEVDDGEV